ncbi:MAG: CDP-archaeol synthase [Victivallales bacterium]|nr:CDP-archaeol synthase [Victivallales bacterium]
MLTERLKTAIPLILVFALSFLLPAPYAGWFFFALCVAGLLLAFREAFAMLRLPPEGSKPLQMVCSAFGLLLLVFSCVGQEVKSLEAAILALFVLCAFLVVFRQDPSFRIIHSLMASLGAFLYLAWTLSFLPRLYFECHPNSLLFLIAVTKMADVGAYAIGVSTAKLPGGNHKITRVLSPKKSWEGLLGGTLFAVLTSLVLQPLLLNSNCAVGLKLPIWTALVTGVVASVAGLLGDLAESCLKRAANVKDSGRIPGIGGVLDVLDSLIPMAPLYYCFLTMVAPHYDVLGG